MTELISSILSGDYNWDALDQSRLNSILLALLVSAVVAAFYGIRAFVRRVYTEMRSDIREAIALAHEAMKEIHELKLTEKGHEGEIRRLKEDVDDLFGRKRRKP